MAEKPRIRTQIKDFPGLTSNVDPDDIPPGGSEIQINVGVTAFGSLTVRKGYQEVRFEDD